MVYGSDRPYFKQQQKKINNITKFCLTGIFLVYYFLLFEKKKKKQNITTYLNNQNQNAFAVIIINYKLINEIILRRFFFCVCYAKYYFLKNTDPKNQIIFIYFADQPTLFFCCFA